jgi:hypothetical protein
VEMGIAGQDTAHALPLIEVLKTNIVDHHTASASRHRRQQFSSYVRDYDFSVVLLEHTKQQSGFSVPDHFGELHGKLFKHFVASPAASTSASRP